MSTPFPSGSYQPGSQGPDPRFSPPTGPGRPVDFTRDGNAWQLPPASGVQRAVGLLAWPMVVLGAFWFGFGHAIMAGGGGWMIFIGMLFAAPIYVVSAGINAILVTMYARRRGQRAAGPWQSRAGLLFYALTLFYPFTVTDFGDTGPALPSRLTAWFGVSEDISTMIAYGLWWVLAVLAILMIVGGAVDMSLLKRDIEPQWVARGYGMGSQHYPLSQPGYGEFRPANQQPGYPYPPAPGQNGPHYSGEDGGYNYPDQSGYYPDQGGYYPNRSGDPSLDQGGYPGPDQSGPRY